MISKKLSSKILIIGTDIEGKGGIAILLKSYSNVFEQFNFVCSHKFATRLMQLLIAIRAIYQVAYYCLFKGIKIVHIHSASYRSFYRESIYLLIAKMLGKKTILHLHGGEFEEFYKSSKKYCDFITHKADCIVGVSSFFGKLFRELNLNKNILVLYNIAEGPLFQKVEWAHDKLKILFMGSIDDNKGIFEVLEMFIKNKNILENKFTLDICGIGDDARLNNLIKSGKLENIVKYHGWVNVIKKNEFLSKTDIYIQPSHFESLGIAIIEAMSYGIPVIATNTGGIPDLITNNENGYLIEISDMDIMLERLLHLYRNRDSINILGKRAKVKSKYFLSKNIEGEIINLYKSLL